MAFEDPCVGVPNKTTFKVRSSTLTATATVGEPGPPGCPIVTDTHVIASPAAGKYYLGWISTATIILRVNVLSVGTTPTSVINFRHSANYTGVGIDLFAVDQAVTSTTTGDQFPATTAFVVGANEILENEHFWLDVVSSDADVLIISYEYQPDCVAVEISAQGVPITLADGTELTIPLETI